MKESTIAAISTPTGSGGIGIIRISGTESVNITENIFRSYSNKKVSDLSGYSGMLGEIIEDNEVIDQAIVYRYIAPKSYTGEDVVELSCHGGIFTLNKVLRLCLNFGAELADSGEFTKRAFFNSKMDLLSSEAVMDIINAQNEMSLKVANEMRRGKLSTQINEIVENIINQSAHLAAWSDYPDEDMEMVDTKILKGQLTIVSKDIEKLLKSYDYGKILKQGIATAIVGKPNVGKSTFMNLLSGYETSIVSNIPGTTRDVVKESIRLGDLMLNVADTAGIRNTDDVIEKMGVQLAKSQIENAQLIIALFDYSDVLTDDDYKLIKLIENANVIVIINKTDLTAKIDLEFIKTKFDHCMEISAKQEVGIEELENMIKDILDLNRFDQGDVAIINNERQRSCLIGAQKSLSEAITALNDGITLDAISVLIEEALDFLLSLTGRKVQEEIVSQLFAQFCVGK